jgi:hypothetical protein
MSEDEEKDKQEKRDEAKSAGAGHGALDGDPFKPKKKETVDDFEDGENK